MSNPNPNPNPALSNHGVPPVPGALPAEEPVAVNLMTCRVSTGPIEVASGEDHRIKVNEGLEFELVPGTALIISEQKDTLSGVVALKIGLVREG